VSRSLFTLDIAAVRANARHVLDVLGGAELWAVVKADGYGHGAADVAVAALQAGATALCVATVPEGVALRPVVPGARVLVLGPTAPDDVPVARTVGLELVVTDEHVPEGVPVHLKLDTGMGRWGLSELPAPGRDVVGLMTHFADADGDPAFTHRQLERFLAATAPYAGLTRHAANSAAALSLPASHLDAARCGIALYGISPFGGEPSRWGLRPALRWESEVAGIRRLAPGDSTGYGRRFVAKRETWIALVPVGYADGFRRDMTGSDVLVGDGRRRVVGTVSMDVIAVETPEPAETGTPVTLIGGGVVIEEHARIAGTIGYEIACGLNTRAPRAERRVVDG
jgi:alanine racemase